LSVSSGLKLLLAQDLASMGSGLLAWTILAALSLLRRFWRAFASSLLLLGWYWGALGISGICGSGFWIDEL